MIFGISKSSRHWLRVALSFISDVVLVWLAFVGGLAIRFGTTDNTTHFHYLSIYFPGILLTSLMGPSILYVGGLYSSRIPVGGFSSSLRWLLSVWVLAFVIDLALGAVDPSARIGRGVLVISFFLLVLMTLLHHALISLRRRRRWRVALCLVSSEHDEIAASLLHCLWGKHARVLGVVTGSNYIPSSDLPVVGTIADLVSAPQGIRIDLLLVQDSHLTTPEFASLLRQCRYNGVEVVSLADACEEAYQAVPLELVTESWLVRASAQNGPFYVRKLKRLFDVTVSAILFVLFSPILLLGALSVFLSSRGPIFYKQVRSGRLGRPFTIYKLRTMRTDSERQGPQWSSDQDNRVFPAGRLMRKFRIDEIPQLLNILKGEMSFVGPRPERPEFVEELAAEIPPYRERLLVTPGLTGWAQVRYPYGSSVEDAKRKLEFDLYYMKHMSLLLDGFIFLETIKTVLFGGVRPKSLEDYAQFRANLFPHSMQPTDLHLPANL